MSNEPRFQSQEKPICQALIRLRVNWRWWIITKSLRVVIFVVRERSCVKEEKQEKKESNKLQIRPRKTQRRLNYDPLHWRTQKITRLVA